MSQYPAYVKVSPSHTLAGQVVQQAQLSGWTETLAGGSPRVELSTGDKKVYVPTLQFRGDAKAGQSPTYNLPSLKVAVGYKEAPVYWLQSYATYSAHDVRDAGNWNINHRDVLSLGNLQSFNVLLRNMCLYGLKPSNGEGLMNTPNATVVNPVASSTSKTSFTGYEPHEFVSKVLLPEILALKARMYSYGTPDKVVVIGSQRDIGYLQMIGVVQLANWQSPGGGTDTIAKMAERLAKGAGIEIIWTIDDTLNNSGAVAGGGAKKDRIIITTPEIAATAASQMGSTNVFSTIPGNIAANNIMLVDRAKPSELEGPIPMGQTEIMFEMQSTSGWGLRGEAITILEASYNEAGNV